MRKTAIVAISAAALLAGCHGHGDKASTGQQAQVGQKAQPAKLDENPPMKGSDIDAIAAEVKERDRRAHGAEHANPGHPAGTSMPTPVAADGKAPQQ